MPGSSLYLIPTPIGNLQDITFRAIDLLRSVDVILAEDTRHSGPLLKHYDISTPMRSFHAHNEHKVLDHIVDEMKSGKVFGLISDAGTPGISDPGFLLSREVLKQGLNVEALPGASAFLPALLKSGFPCDRFVFEGFLPHKKGRNTRLDHITTETRTQILYESPHRLVKTLEQLTDRLGPQAMISVSRELTKKFEETVTGTTQDVLSHYEQSPPKGEFVIVIGPR